MWAPTSQASPRSMRAYASPRFTLPARMLLISVPVSTMPGLEGVLDGVLVAGLAIDGDGLAHGRLLGGVGGRRARRRVRPDARTPAQVGRRFVAASPPEGLRLARPLRGGAALPTVDHCTSPPFVPGHHRRTRSRTQGVGRRSGGRRAATGSRADGRRRGAVGERSGLGRRRRRRGCRVARRAGCRSRRGTGHDRRRA